MPVVKDTELSVNDTEFPREVSVIRETAMTSTPVTKMSVRIGTGCGYKCKRAVSYEEHKGVGDE